MSHPKLLDTPLYALLRKDDIAGFNSQRPQGPIDMRGGDFRKSSLEGASLAHAQISGTYFPPELSADEILMSMNFGTRLRYRTR